MKLLSLAHRDSDSKPVLWHWYLCISEALSSISCLHHCPWFWSKYTTHHFLKHTFLLLEMNIVISQIILIFKHFPLICRFLLPLTLLFVTKIWIYLWDSLRLLQPTVLKGSSVNRLANVWYSFNHRQNTMPSISGALSPQWEVLFGTGISNRFIVYTYIFVPILVV